MRSFVAFENSGDRSAGVILVGTMNIRPSGISIEFVFDDDVSLAMLIVGANELIAESDLLAQFDCPRLFR